MSSAERPMKRASHIRRNIDLLKQTPILEGLSSDQLEKVLAIMTEIEVPPGEEIIRDGEPGDTMYILTKGAVQVSKTLTLKVSRRDFGEKEKRLIVLDSRDYPAFGEVALLENDKRTATVTALTESKLFEIERLKFEQLCEQEPIIGYRIIRNIAKGICAHLHKANMDILKLTTALSIALR